MRDSCLAARKIVVATSAPLAKGLKIAKPHFGPAGSPRNRKLAIKKT
jgi:hypothetical protein